MLKGITRGYRHIKRYREIVEVLIKHGFGYLVEVMDLYHLVPLTKRLKKLDSSKPPKDTRAIRIRKVLEELGPTFIKLGQLLSTRPDLLPRSYIEELEKLQEEVPPMDFEQVVKRVEEELGGSYHNYFTTLSAIPLASASIGQVHQGTLNNGEQVVVKVQRVDIESKVETDLEIMKNLAQMLEKRLFTQALISPVEIVDNFSELIKRELDYRIEARNSTKFKKNFAEEVKVGVADPVWELTTRRMLTMEYIAGKKIGELGSKSTREEMAKIITRSFMKQTLIDGFFHGDPHPGNIIITPDNKLALIDFGLVGQLSRVDREAIASLFISLIRKDAQRAVKELLKLGVVTNEINCQELQRDFYKLIDDYYGATLSDIELGVIINRMLDIAYSYKIKLPSEFILLTKSLITIEGVVSKLAPELDILAIGKPFVYQLLKNRYHPKRLFKNGMRDVRDIIEILAGLPDSIQQILTMIDDKNLTLKLEHLGIKEIISKLDIVTNRLSVSLIVSALIIGSSLMMLSDKGATFFNFPVIGVTGYIIAVVLGFWLVISILRSGRF
ncbi:putative unusual protein kinase [Halobacteroides halobius DSM 5150]|uniref:Putative unusual protein kinase n=1 Tax=Halobacteroides halobius (strain ATCC 35273 / DSM 5150 / MD-1) TaxID=748449 RepID=L0K8Z8_HALHC|nr:AarF/ABC1/UbiB kinase family protein [Halobacteroides halobius]AGB41762.1 putative unusual protein kinase [Halobacteroides halobius DSM 5150]